MLGSRLWERGVPAGNVCRCLLDETYKDVCVSTDGDEVRVLYVMEYRHECLANLEDIIVRRLADDGGEFLRCFCKEESDGRGGVGHRWSGLSS